MNTDMYLPVSQILYDDTYQFSEIIFTLNTRDFNRLQVGTEGQKLRAEFMPTFTKQYLLCNAENTKPIL